MRFVEHTVNTKGIKIKFKNPQTQLSLSQINTECIYSIHIKMYI